MSSRSDNLPQSLTTFVGREREIDDLSRLLKAGRCVTLVGPGGVGKSRLALQLARGRLAGVDAAWHVDLARLGAVDGALASVLGVHDERGESLTSTITAAIGESRVIVVLDNCERVAADCAILADALLEACPGIELVATSRQPLGLEREDIQQVAPLDVSEAERLFIERARIANPAFAATTEALELVRQICTRVEGLPLAIELAAACARLLTPAQILARLTDRFRLLAGTGRGADPRHRTLRATIDWSFEMLSPEAQTLFARVSVFSGGFSAAAARVVCAGEGLEEERIANLLEGLVENSLAYVDLDGDRYRMLDTIHEYARERLAASGELARWSKAHRDWFLAIAELARDAVQGSGQGAWLDSLETDRANLLSALAWTVEKERDGAAALRFVAALYRFWELHGHEREGRSWITRAIELADGREPMLEAEARFGLAILAFSQGDFELTRAEVEKCLELRREEGDREGIAKALNLQSLAADFLNEFELAIALQEESLSLSRELGLSASVNQGTYHLGLLALRRGDLDRAAELLAASVDGWHAAGNRIAAAGAAINLAEAVRLRGDLDAARTHSEASLAVALETGATRLVAACLLERAHICADAGDVHAALEAYRESAAIYRDSGMQEGLVEIVDCLSILAARRGNLDLALDLEATAATERRAIKAPRDPELQHEMDEALSGRTAVQAPGWTIDEAVESGLRQADE